MSLLEVKNLSISFHHPHGYDYKVVKNINFELNKGEILGIVGESGSGKSLTALSILGLLPYPKAFHSKESSIKYQEQELLYNPNIQSVRGKKIGFVFQEPMSSLNPLHTIEHQISETLILHQKLTKTQARHRTLELLKKTGIQQAEERLKAYPHQLSGGQRQRVMIAMAIANHPDILIADEPTTALDTTIASEIIDLLIKLKQDLKMSVIFISHDLGLVQKIADRVLVMKNGKIIESGICNDVFQHPQENYTKALIYSFNALKKNNFLSNKAAVSIKNILVKFPITKNFFGKVTNYLNAVDHVSLDIKKGKTLGIVGESGSGKTTLAMALSGLIKFEGNIKLDETDITALTNKQLRKKIQIVFQDPYNSLNPRMTVFEIIEEGLRVHFPQLSKEEKILKIKQVIQEVDLKEEALYKYPHEFSGGQRQRIAIARALIIEPEILILDEPTSALDVTIASRILKLLQQIQRERKLTYLFISHDMRSIYAISDDIAVMKNGKIIEYNNANAIFNTPQQAYTKALVNTTNLGKYHAKTKNYKHRKYSGQIQRS